MKKHIQNNPWLWIGILAALLALAYYAKATLSATVDPGYEFTSGERLTVQKLNALGLPTVTVVGTVTGSLLGTNSVDKANLKTNVADQVTIVGGDNTVLSVNYDDTTIGVISSQLAVKDDGITTAKIGDDQVTAAKLADDWISTLTTVTPTYADSIAFADATDSDNMKNTSVATLFQDALGPWLKVASTTTPADDDRLLLMDEDVVGDLGRAVTVSDFKTAIGNAPNWTTNNVTIAAGVPFDVPHTLSRAAYDINAWIVFSADDATAGYKELDEVPVEAVVMDISNYTWPFVTVGSNETNVFATVGANTVVWVLHRDTGVVTATGITNMTLKVSVW